MVEIPNQSRFRALDGLRGIAALIVLVHHVELVSPQLEALTSAGPDISRAPLFWLATYTPLHALWAGTESVFLFFVLSGFVLTLPFLRMNRPSWLSYYPKRMVRLYVPVWASVALALLLAFLVPRVADPRFSGWINPHSGPVSVLNNASLLGTDDLNSPLWSLTWEVLFSLLLPAYLVLALKFRRFWIVGTCGLLLAIGIADMVHNIALLYLPMFGIGVLMAVQKDLLAAWCGHLGRWGWALLFTVALIMFTARWTFTGMIGSVALSTLGSALIILAFLYCRPAVRLGSTRSVQWAGRRSFSLYLVHEPIVVSAAFGLHTTNPLLVLVVALPASLAVAELFYRAIEIPSHRLASVLGNILGPAGAPSNRAQRRTDSTESTVDVD